MSGGPHVLYIIAAKSLRERESIFECLESYALFGDS